MDKRYQVFVSSTYKDLQEERQEVMHALLELDCIPAGMELFPAANEDQWSLISEVIDDCDYYMVIIAGRYGSVGPGGMGYTEKEYRYALERRKPVIAFLHKAPSSIPARNTEGEPELKERLEAFRQLAEQKMCKYWTTATELGSVVSRSLVQLIKRTPAVGWVRADQLPDENATAEILRLRRRVEELESKLALEATKPPEGTEDLAQGDDVFEIPYSCSVYVVIHGEQRKAPMSGEIRSSWNEIFAALSPEMIDESSELALLRTLERFVLAKATTELQKQPQYAEAKIGSVELDRSVLGTCKVQLRALGLITQSDRLRTIEDRQTYWTLTRYGDALMTKVRAIRRSSGDLHDGGDGPPPLEVEESMSNGQA